MNIGKLQHRNYIALPLLLTLGVSVADEYIQVISERGSMVTDVALDFSGSLASLTFVVLCCLFGRNNK